MPVMRQLDIVQPVEGRRRAASARSDARAKARLRELGLASGGVIATASDGHGSRIELFSRIHLGERGAPDCSAARHGPTFSERRPRMASGGP